MKRIPSLTIFLIGILTLVLFFLTSTGVAQEVRWIRVSQLHNYFSSAGAEREGGYPGNQQTGLVWPAQYRDQDNVAAKAMWIAASNFTDHEMYGGNTWPAKVIHSGPRSWDLAEETIPVTFKIIGKFSAPQVVVDELNSGQLFYDDLVDEIDENLVSDRLLINTINTPLGITITRKVYVWTQQYHNNYYLYEYTLKNTGNVDSDPEIEWTDKAVDDVYAFFQYRYAVSRQGATWTDLNSPRWGICQMLSTRGEARSDTTVSGFIYPGDYEEWLNGNTAADSMRSQFAWMGKHSSQSYDILGSPDVKYGTGRLGSPQFIGNITLHTDRGVDDKTDDPQQPTTTSYLESDAPITRPADPYDKERMLTEWREITKGHRLPRHEEVVGNGFPDLLEGTTGGFSNTSGYGPFDLAHGDSVTIVIAEGVHGLSRQKSSEIGSQWYTAYQNKSTSYTFPMPDGSTVTGTFNDGTADEFKNTWFFSGQDSLFQTFSRARRNFESGYSIPSAPPPPNFFEVNSGGDRISLSWASNAESSPGFAGYRIYRAIGAYDTTYTKIFECGAGTAHPAIVNSFDDTSAVRGFSYYYYIVSYDDGSNNTSGINPPGSLHSSLFYTRTTDPAYLRRQAGESLDDIRVVPNPFNIRSRALQFPNEPDKITFLNIPAFCTIRIYTERGDHIQTIEHTDGSGDESWNSNTKYGQVVVSGIYFARIEVTQDYEDPETNTPLYRKGDVKTVKFVVIR